MAIAGGVVAVVLLFSVVLWLNRGGADVIGVESTTTTATAETTTTLASTTTTDTTTTTTSTADTTTTSPDSSSSVPATSPPGPLPTSPDPDAGEEEDDPVPYQTSVKLSQWQIGVSLADLDATDTVLDFVPFNDPPAQGHVYVLVELSGEYLGSGIAQPVFDWKLEGPDFEHTPDGLECGVIPESIYDVGDVAAGASFKANVCFEVPTEAIGPDLVLSLGLFDDTGRERFFALS